MKQFKKKPKISRARKSSTCSSRHHSKLCQ